MLAVSTAHSAAVLRKAIPGSHSGRIFITGKKSTGNAPGTVAALKFALAPSIKSTNGSSPSWTSYPYVNFRITPPASLRHM